MIEIEWNNNDDAGFPLNELTVSVGWPFFCCVSESLTPSSLCPVSTCVHACGDWVKQICECFACCKIMVNFVIFFDTVYYCSQMLLVYMCWLWPKCAFMTDVNSDKNKTLICVRLASTSTTYSFIVIRKSSPNVNSLHTLH